MSLSLFVGGITLSLLGVLLAARAAYPAWTRMRALRAEGRAAWDPEGIRCGMQPFVVGEGDPTLIMIHGFASSPSVFRCMASALAARGYCCRAMRLPGFGERIGQMTKLSEADWRRAVEQEVAIARAQNRSVWLVGHSMGGTLALDFAMAHPERIEGLILLAPLIAVSPRRSWGLPPEWLHRAATRLISGTTIIETAFPVDLHARKDGIDEQRDEFLPRSLYDAMFRLINAVRSRPGPIALPTLIVVPRSDRVVSRRATLRFFAQRRSDGTRIITAENAGHVIPLDYGWPDVVDEMQRFIQGKVRRRSPA